MKDDTNWTEAILRLRKPLEPEPTSVAPKLETLDEIRAVIFDVYGTLLISGSGDVGSSDETTHTDAFEQAIEAVPLHFASSARPSVTDLKQKIGELNALRRSEKCPHPEVDVVEAWRQILAEHDCFPPAETTVRLACEYEARANRTWPMPGAERLLRSLRGADLALGIVSNAQIFTLPLIEALLDPPRLQQGFELDLCLFSNRFRQAKPGPRLFNCLVDGLQRRGIRPQQALYVGNDMLNDVWAAHQADLRTAWFAGDNRSCRPRNAHRQCQSLQPDVVITELMQLHSCLQIP